MARGRPATCPYCGGRSINKGFRLTKTMGKRRLKQCKVCRRKFTPKNQKSVDSEESASGSNFPADEIAEKEVQSASREEGKSEPAKVEPTDDSKPLLNALDEEWTS